MPKGSIHIGTSGWSYGTWRGVFYPEGVKSANYLQYYAQVFSCTEVNSSFYHLPREKTITGWLGQVPKRFIFCPKMSRYLTHIKRLKDPEAPLEKFFQSIGVLKKQMGPVLLQLPPTLKFEVHTAKTLYALLSEKYKQYQFAVEGRHPSWLEQESLQLMKAHNIAFVISQSGVGFPYAEEVTAKNIYIRFHGPAELFKSSYEITMLAYYAEKIASWRKKGHSVWVFFNNTWFNDAIVNARDLIKLIEYQ